MKRPGANGNRGETIRILLNQLYSVGERNEQLLLWKWINLFTYSIKHFGDRDSIFSNISVFAAPIKVQNELGKNTNVF